MVKSIKNEKKTQPNFNKHEKESVFVIVMTSTTCHCPGFLDQGLKLKSASLFIIGLGLVFAVVIAKLGSQQVDVACGDLDDAQLGQFDVVVLDGDEGPQLVIGLCDGLDPLPFPGIGLHPPFLGHVLVVSCSSLVFICIKDGITFLGFD